ncbi:SSU ribosomal protein S16P [Mycobacterium tuberculosis]|nr:SSU ribosomal protein S16P [Mycobacterium tuberculosis]
MAVKIKLTRLGKIRNPQYRVAAPMRAPAATAERSR